MDEAGVIRIVVGFVLPEQVMNKALPHDTAQVVFFAEDLPDDSLLDVLRGRLIDLGHHRSDAFGVFLVPLIEPSRYPSQ